MPSPFPGMDLYLENPELWAEFHHRLITAIAIDIAPHIRPKYQVAIENAFGLREEIPPFPLPLYSGDAEPRVELQALLSEVYEQAGYDLRVDYTQQPMQLLKEGDATWLDALLREKGLR